MMTVEIYIRKKEPLGYPIELWVDDYQQATGAYLPLDCLPWVSTGSAKDDGQTLFKQLYQHDPFKQGWGEAQGLSDQRRIRLRLDPEAPELHTIPWECLVESGLNRPDKAIAAAAETPFSRYIAGKAVPFEPISTRPIKLLLAIANPDNLADYDLSPINVETERTLLSEALADLTPQQVQLTVMDEPITLANLEAKLQAGYHLLHVVAHGRLNKKSPNRAGLCLADKDNHVAITDEADFAAMLSRQAKPPGLIFLAACQTANHTPDDALRGVAPQLIAEGVPTVLAMQDAVSVETAQAFTQTFYRRLLAHGQVDLATNEARSALLSRNLPGPAIPVLFSRLLDNRLLAAPPSRRADPTIPLQRPPRAEHFTNREQELATMLGQLQPGQTVTLCGPGGMGKSALAAEAIWTLTDNHTLLTRFPDGVIWHSFYTKPQTEQALQHIVQSLEGEIEGDLEGAAQRLLGGKQLLLLLDGTEEADNLRRFRPLTADCGVIITSRKQADAFDSRQRHPLSPLPQAEAVDLLQAFVGRTADPTSLTAICERLGGLPLAVRLVGRYLAETGEPPAAYLAWLQDTPIAALSQGEHQDESVAVLLGRSLAQVSQEAQQLLAMSGRLALAPFKRAWLEAVFEKSFQQLRGPLNELIGYGLLRVEGEQYAVSHALIHSYVRARLPLATAWVTKLEETLKTEAYELNQAGYPLAMTWADHLRYLTDAALARQDELAATLAINLAYYLQQVANYEAARPYFEQALAIYREVFGEGHPDTARSLNNLGGLLDSMGDYEAARPYFEQALSIWREVLGEDHPDTAKSLNNLGMLLDSMGEYEAARP